jgi:DNA primase
MGRIKYSEFVDLLDVESLMADIGFDPLHMDNRGNYVGYCLWPENHTNGDTTGKFAIHPDKKVYNCYVCGGGSLLSMMMELNGWDSETAENYLRQFAGDARNDNEFVEDFLNAFAQDTEKRVETMPYFNERVLEKFEPAYEWGESVGLKPEVIDAYRVLYSATAVKRSPGKGKFTDVPDYKGPAIIWPHYWNDRLVGWQTRWLDDNRPEFVKKWTNTVDFPKESTLYGLHLVKGARSVYVLESAKSVLKLDQLGKDAVGTFGSNVNPAQLRLLRRFQSGIILWPDNDKAGNEWFVTCYNYLKRYVPVHGVAPVTGSKGDPADLTDEEILEHLENYTFDLTFPSFGD